LRNGLKPTTYPTRSRCLWDSNVSHSRANERNAELKGNCTSLSTKVDRLTSEVRSAIGNNTQLRELNNEEEHVIVVAGCAPSCAGPPTASSRTRGSRRRRRYSWTSCTPGRRGSAKRS
jgi:hypothetical protein